MDATLQDEASNKKNLPRFCVLAEQKLTVKSFIAISTVGLLECCGHHHH